MTEERGAESAEARGTPTVETEPQPIIENPPRAASGGSRHVALSLAAVLAWVVAGVLLSPFWAPAIAPLLPWGGQSSVGAEEYAALASRLASVERRPAPRSTDLDAIASTANALTRRVDQLETVLKATDRQTEAAAAPIRSELQQIEQRLGAGEALSASQAAKEAAEIEKMQQELARLGTATADLADRLAALDRRARAASSAERSDSALLLALLQIREAVEEARPFSTEYAAFTALFRDHPDLAAAAEPLAAASRNGVPGRAALSRRLAELAGSIANAAPAPAQSDWGARVLARLRGLVTIRRVDGASQTAPEATVNTAELALARGDLTAAIAALEGLSGANAAAAQPWLRMARERLAVETALARVQEILVARLGSVPAPAGGVPAEAPAVPRAPS